MSSTFPTSFLGNFHPRKLLAGFPFPQTIHVASSPEPSSTNLHAIIPENESFNVDVVMILVVLVCGLICSLGINVIIRCSNSFLHRNPNSAAVRRANKGLKQRVLKSFRTVKYSPENQYPGLDTDCVICLSEFAMGDLLRILPKCNHGFHVKCIDKWLSSHSSCPTCRHCLIETSKNVAGGDATQVSSLTEQPVPVQELIIRIAPLDREGVVNSRETSL